jgi:hypothetical protein
MLMDGKVVVIARQVKKKTRRRRRGNARGKGKGTIQTQE